jgi:chaperonin GroES
MLELDQHLVFDQETIDSPNLCDKFSSEDLDKIGAHIHDGYERDRTSREKWEKRTTAAMDLAMQLQKAKNFPWPGAANIAFPLVTIAAMQFHSRAYPAIIQGTNVVRYRVIGDDPTGQEAERAKRIGTHMSWQLTEQDRGWEEQLDRALLVVPIAGCAFKKSYHSSKKGYNVSDLVLPYDLVMDYYAKSVEDARRKTHIIPMYKNDLHTMCKVGMYRDVTEEGWYKSPSPPTANNVTAARDKRLGKNPPQSDDDTPFQMLEQHCWLDLDNDGYDEPYVVTIEDNSACVVRIVARCDDGKDVERLDDGSIISIQAFESFTKMPFIPSPDGGVYDIGFGVLLGPLNETTNSLINQLVDAGTMATAAGGFLGRGAKIRGGVYTFAPLEWKRVDSTGDDLKKSIFPLPVREPSNVLFQLLGLVIDYSNRIAGSTDMMVGQNPGQNTPAQTSQAMVEQGSKIYSAIFKRFWRAMQNEFMKLYVLNGIYLPDKQTFGENGAFALRSDYLGDPTRIAPVADPSAQSDQQRFMKAQALIEVSSKFPGYDPDIVQTRFLEAIQVEGISQVYGGIKKFPPGTSEKVQIENMKLQAKNADSQFLMQKFAAELLEEQRVNSAVIMELQAKAAKAIADANSEQQFAEIAKMNAQISLAKAEDDKLMKRLKLLMDGIKINGQLEKDADGE